MYVIMCIYTYMKERMRKKTSAVSYIPRTLVNAQNHVI